MKERRAVAGKSRGNRKYRKGGKENKSSTCTTKPGQNLEGESKPGAKKKRVKAHVHGFLAAEAHLLREQNLELRKQLLAAQSNAQQEIAKRDLVIAQRDMQILEFEGQSVDERNRLTREKYGLRLDATIKEDDDTGEVYYEVDDSGDEEAAVEVVNESGTGDGDEAAEAKSCKAAADSNEAEATK